jgi:hypothetical protein
MNLPRLHANLAMGELFDDIELKGNSTIPPLVSIEAVVANNLWFVNKTNPLIYADYPLLGLFTFKNRIPSELGVPPVKNIFFEEYGFSTGVVRQIAYGLYEVADSDLKDLRTQISDYVARIGYYPSDRLRQIILGNTPSYDPGDYPVRLKYTIPGVNVETSNTTKNISWVVVIK